MIKVAVVGAGYMAKEHVMAFNDIDNVKVVGIFSRTKSKASSLASEFNIDFVTNSIENLFEKTQADIVVNAASVFSIYDVSINLLKYPWTILIEKPPGLNYNQALNLKDEILKNNSKVFVALNRRHYSSTRKALSLLANDNSRRVVNVLDQQDLNDPIRLGMNDLIQKNWMYANSIHLIDYFSIFCRGNIVNIHSSSEWDNNNPFLVSSKLDYDSGDIGYYQAIWNAPSPWSINVINSSLRLEMKPLEKLTKQNYPNRNSIDVKIDNVDLSFKPGLRHQAYLLVNSLSNKNSTLPTIDDTLITMHNIKKIYNLKK